MNPLYYAFCNPPESSFNALGMAFLSLTVSAMPRPSPSRSIILIACEHLFYRVNVFHVSINSCTKTSTRSVILLCLCERRLEMNVASYESVMFKTTAPSSNVTLFVKKNVFQFLRVQYYSYSNS